MCDLYIDNLRALSPSSEALRCFCRHLAVLANRVNLQFNETCWEVKPTGSFLGFDFDYQQCSFALSSKARAKVASIADSTADDRGFLRAVGILVYYSSALRIPLAQFWIVIHEVLKLVAHKVFTHSTIVDQSIVSWRNCVLDTPALPTVRQPSVGHIALMTDASLVGWGAVLFVDERMTASTSGLWLNTPVQLQNINVMEITAVGLALRHFGRLRGQQVFLIVDNMATFAAIEKGFSNTSAMNRALAEIRSACSRFRIAIQRIAFVPSHLNAADAFSRDSALDGSRADELLALLMGSLRPHEVRSPRVEYAAKRTRSSPGDGPGLDLIPSR